MERSKGACGPAQQIFLRHKYNLFQTAFVCLLLIANLIFLCFVKVFLQGSCRPGILWNRKLGWKKISERDNKAEIVQRFILKKEKRLTSRVCECFSAEKSITFQ